MRKRRTIGRVSPSALEDEWQRQATAAAIAAARGVIRIDGAIPPNTPVGRLGDVEWGWITAAILFGWIQTRARQAVAENLDTERTVRMTALDPDPWDAGAAMAILPELAAACSHIDWSKPLLARDDGRVSDHRHAADPQGNGRARHQRQGRHAPVKRQRDCPRSQCRCRRPADDAKRIRR
jgi:hypothetical protein